MVPNLRSRLNQDPLSTDSGFNILDSCMCPTKQLQAIARARRSRIDLYPVLSPTADILLALRSVPALLVPVELHGIERPTVGSLGG